MKARIALAIIVLGLGLGLSPFASARTESAPSPKTKPALACLLGMGPAGCETSFVGAIFSRGQVPVPNRGVTRFGVSRLISYCANKNVHYWLDNCSSGVLETVQYLGTNAAGADVYDVKFLNCDMTYVIAPPAQDGKTPAFSIMDAASPIQAIPHRLIAVTSPANPVRTLYTRNEEQSQTARAPGN
jgi:hypothetical protein